MKASVVNIHTGGRKDYIGTDYDVKLQLLHDYMWLRTKHSISSPLQDILNYLSKKQTLFVYVSSGYMEHGHISKSEEPLSVDELGLNKRVVTDMLGTSYSYSILLEAARFLTGKTFSPQSEKERARRGLFMHPHDLLRAALFSYDLEISDDNIRGVKSIAAGSLSKSTPELKGDVVAVRDEGKAFAESVSRAYDAGYVFPIALGGKHSLGSLFALDEVKDLRYILKPGSGENHPSSGIHQIHASQSKREVCFYDVAKSWRLEASLAEVHLVLIDKKEYSVIKILPWSYHTVLDTLERDPVGVHRTLDMYGQKGLLHKWATLDYTLGNPDRHSGNLMFSDGDIKLIDHGSTMSGNLFNPAKDKYSFVPYYLYHRNAHKGPQEASEAIYPKMVGVPSKIEKELRRWLIGLNKDAVRYNLYSFGINPEPAMERLSRIKKLLSHKTPSDAINWVWTHSPDAD